MTFKIVKEWVLWMHFIIYMIYLKQSPSISYPTFLFFLPLDHPVTYSIFYLLLVYSLSPSPYKVSSTRARSYWAFMGNYMDYKPNMDYKPWKKQLFPLPSYSRNLLALSSKITVKSLTMQFYGNHVASLCLIFIIKLDLGGTR